MKQARARGSCRSSSVSSVTETTRTLGSLRATEGLRAQDTLRATEDLRATEGLRASEGHRGQNGVCAGPGSNVHKAPRMLGSQMGPCDLKPANGHL